MRKFATRNEYILGVVIALFVLVGTAYAVTKSFRADGGVRMLGSATPGTTGTAANPVVWSDATARPNLRFGDGTGNEYVAACAVTTNGDVCSWNGTNWIRSAGSGVTFPISNGSSSVTFNYGGTMSGSTAAYSYDTTNAYGVGDKISFKSATVEFMKLTQSFAGLWDFVSTNANIGMLNSTGDGVRVQGAGTMYFYFGGAANWVVSANDISPNSATSPSLGAVVPFTTAKVKHFIGGSAAPTKAAGACIGGTQTVTLDANANDASGNITLTGTATGTVSAICATVTFNVAYGTAPHCTISPANAAAAALGTTAALFVDSASTTTAVFVIKVGSTALVAGTYIYTYDCMQ